MEKHSRLALAGEMTMVMFLLLYCAFLDSVHVWSELTQIWFVFVKLKWCEVASVAMSPSSVHYSWVEIKSLHK